MRISLIITILFTFLLAAPRADAQSCESGSWGRECSYYPIETRFPKCVQVGKRLRIDCQTHCGATPKSNSCPTGCVAVNDTGSPIPCEDKYDHVLIGDYANYEECKKAKDANGCSGVTISCPGSTSVSGICAPLQAIGIEPSQPISY